MSTKGRVKVKEKVKDQLAPGLKKIKESASRTSLTLVLSVFVFAILICAISLAALGIWALARFGVLVAEDGELRLGTALILMTAISLLIGAVLVFFSSRIPLRPINELINKMNRLAAGDFAARLEFAPSLASHPAVGEIVQSFNTMAEELQNTELLRSDFINNFSHEFKTPIVSIMGLAGLLSRGNLGEAEREQYARAIEEESRRLSVMASNVLELSRVENQRILTDITCYNLAEQLRGAILLLEDKWSAKEIELELELREYTIEANEELMRQVWINILDNAIKFAPQGAVVSVITDRRGDRTRVRIKNTGSRIPEDKLDKIFGKFYQADESHAAQGNGIGLAIVRRIVELHGGEITAASDDEGTTFEVLL